MSWQLSRTRLRRVASRERSPRRTTRRGDPGTLHPSDRAALISSVRTTPQSRSPSPKRRGPPCGSSGARAEVVQSQGARPPLSRNSRAAGLGSSRRVLALLDRPPRSFRAHTARPVPQHEPSPARRTAPRDRSHTRRRLAECFRAHARNACGAPQAALHHLSAAEPPAAIGRDSADLARGGVSPTMKPDNPRLRRAARDSRTVGGRRVVPDPRRTGRSAPRFQRAIAPRAGRRRRCRLYVERGCDLASHRSARSAVSSRRRSELVPQRTASSRSPAATTRHPRALELPATLRPRRGRLTTRSPSAPSRSPERPIRHSRIPSRGSRWRTSCALAGAAHPSAGAGVPRPAAVVHS